MTDGGVDFAETFPSASYSISPPVAFPAQISPVLCPLRVYTDGSATSGVGRCSASVFLRFGSAETDLSAFVGVGSILMAELFALRMAS